MPNEPRKDGIKKPIRSKSGITTLTVVLPPRKCDHGTCIYCPGGDTVPQSYTDKSPAVMRAMSLNYDIRCQVKARLETLKSMGHPTDKLEVIIIGGTFLQYDKKFKYNYVKGIYDELNEKESNNLDEAKKINETCKNRIVAFCIENRPDNCTKKDIKEMLEFGATRIEIGVQILDDKIYKKINRGHSVKDVIDASKRLKDAGFKLGYHIMPGLPFSNEKNDLEKFKLVFNDQKFRPDQLKLYPCQVVDDSPLGKIYDKIKYEPYSNEKIKNLLIKMFTYIPNYCRVMRIMREIPKEKMKGVAASTSMRHDLQEELKKATGIKEIRFREVGLQNKELNTNLKTKITEYSSSGGREYFLEVINDEDILFGLLRLRIPSDDIFIDELKNSAIVRELHVYGKTLKLGEIGILSQHRGIGKQLMREAEKITKENNIKKVAVISGIGVREYYRKLGYELEGNYMVKGLN